MIPQHHTTQQSLFMLDSLQTRISVTKMTKLLAVLQKVTAFDGKVKPPPSDCLMYPSNV